MARIRTIKPEFWTSEQLVECSRDARLLFIGMWNFCDDGGVMPASVKSLKMKIFPGDDDTSESVRRLIDELIENGLILEYQVENKTYWQVTGWHHQKIDRPTYKYPPSPDSSSSNVPRTLDETSPPEGKGKEGKVRERNIGSVGESSPPSPVAFTLPLNTGDQFPITEAQVAEWSSLYPNVDVIQQLRSMKGWCDSNPSKRKTKNGILRFVNSWLSREQDKGPSKSNQVKPTGQSKLQRAAANLGMTGGGNGIPAIGND